MAKIAQKISELLGNDEAVRKKKEQFQFLQKMATAKCAEFKSDLEKMYMGDKANTEISGNRAMRYYMSQHIDIKSGCNEAVGKAVDSFFKGKAGLKDGFKSLVTGALDVLINTTTIGETQEDMFFVYPENLAVVRLDVKTYKYNFSNKGLIADCENIFCYTMAKSVVDHTQLTIDELVYMMSEMSGSEDVKTVEAFVTELTNLWAMLENPQKSATKLQIQGAKEVTPITRGEKQVKPIQIEISTIDELEKTVQPLGWNVEKTFTGDKGNTQLEYAISKVSEFMKYYKSFKPEQDSINETVKYINEIEAPHS